MEKATVPDGKAALKSHKILHHPVYYLVLLLAAIILMLLAIFEEPSVYVERKPTSFIVSKCTSNELCDFVFKHLLIELFLLTLFVFDLILRLIWLKPVGFIKSRATLVVTQLSILQFSIFIIFIQCIVLAVMYVEIVIIFLTGYRHTRITRAVRSIFLLDAYIMFGVRRYVNILLTG